jgi:single-stranded DNA-binding protein
MGTLVDEPSMKYAPSGLAITNFVLETPSSSANRPNDKHNVVVFGKGQGDDGLAGWCAQYLKMGSKIILQGSLGGQEFTTQAGKKFLNAQVAAFKIEAL